MTSRAPRRAGDLRWPLSLDYVFGQRYAAALPCPSDDPESHGKHRKAVAESKDYQEDPGRNERTQEPSQVTAFMASLSAWVR